MSDWLKLVWLQEAMLMDGKHFLKFYVCVEPQPSLASMTVRELRGILRNLGISPKRKKADMIEEIVHNKNQEWECTIRFIFEMMQANSEHVSASDLDWKCSEDTHVPETQGVSFCICL